MKHTIIVEVKGGCVQEAFSTLKRGKGPLIYVIDRDGEAVGEGARVWIEDVNLITKRAAEKRLKKARESRVETE